MVTVNTTGPGNLSAQQKMWVDIPQEKLNDGLAVTLTQPTDGQSVQQAFDIEADVINFSQSQVQGVEFSIDGKYSHTDYSEPYAWTPPWQEMAGLEHTLKVLARDNRGKQTEVIRHFELSPFFDLQPSKGINISGENVRISWLGNNFGEANLKIRKAGSDEAWKTIKGDSGRYRSVLVENLEPGNKYEYIASDGSTESPLQTFNLVKGIGFWKTILWSQYQARLRPTARHFRA